MIDDAARAIARRRGQLAELTGKLIRFESLTGPDGQERPIQEWLAGRLEQLGAEVDLWDVEADPYGEALAVPRPNVVGTWPGGGSGRSLLFNAHVDVVPADRAGWTHGPFGGVVRDGAVWGRGSVDTKGGLASALVAVEALREVGWRPAGAFSIHCVMGEESGDGGSHAAIVRGHRADAAIIAEPTELTAQPVEGGFQLLTIGVEGVAGHACERWRIGAEAEPASAIDKGLVLTGALRELDGRWRTEKRHDLFPAGWASIGVNVVHGGTTFGSIPDRFEAECAVWYLPGEDGASVQAEVEAALESLIAADPWLRAHPPELRWSLDYPPTVTETDAPVVAGLREALVASGREPRVKAFRAVSDMRWLRAEHGIPSVLFGPGALDQAHAVDERVSIDDLVGCAQVLARTFAGWCRSA